MFNLDRFKELAHKARDGYENLELMDMCKEAAEYIVKLRSMYVKVGESDVASNASTQHEITGV